MIHDQNNQVHLFSLKTNKNRKRREAAAGSEKEGFPESRVSLTSLHFTGFIHT